jgi:hypothetical protein
MNVTSGAQIVLPSNPVIADVHSGGVLKTLGPDCHEVSLVDDLETIPAPVA